MYFFTMIHWLIFQVTQQLANNWQAVIRSVSIALITTFIFKNQKSKFHTQHEVTAWATKQLTDWCFLYANAKGNNMKVSYYYGNIFYFADFIYDRNGVASSVVEPSWAPSQLISWQLKVPNESQILKLMVWNLHSLRPTVPLHWAQLG